jgi:alkylation response protein AidB-like acyl-CoA dehydrogenase
MDFALDEQQLAFQAGVAELLANRFDTAAVRAAYDDPDFSGHPEKLWAEISDQGWLAITVPAELDGLGLGLVDAQIVARGIGAGTVPGPWLVSTLAIEAIRLAGSAEQQAQWLPKLATGELIGTHALEQSVDLDGDRVTGRLLRVEHAAVAGILVVADRSGRLGLVDLQGTGVQLTAQAQYDLTTRFSIVELDSAPVHLLDADRRPEVLRRATVLTAAELVGAARESHNRTVAYDKQRVQFGHPVGSFQAIKHELANLHVAVTMAEQAVLYAAHALDQSNPDAELAVSVAKAKASRAAKDATAAMIQFTGGIAFTWEHEAHHYFKRVKRQAATFGDAAAHQERIAALLLDTEPVGG